MSPGLCSGPIPHSVPNLVRLLSHCPLWGGRGPGRKSPHQAPCGKGEQEEFQWTNLHGVPPTSLGSGLPEKPKQESRGPQWSRTPVQVFSHSGVSGKETPRSRETQGGKELLETNSQQLQKGTDENHLGDFPGGPVVKTPHFQCRGHRFNPWWGD